MDELDRNERYIVRCHAGGRGTRGWPFATTTLEDTVVTPLKKVVNANQSLRSWPE